MKKLLILALVLVVAGGLFAQAAGPTVTFSGQLQYGTLMSTDTKYAVPGDYVLWVARWDTKFTDFTKFVFRLRQKGDIVGGVANATNAATNPAVYVPQYAWMESNILGELGIKEVGYTINFGLDDHETIDLAAPVSYSGLASVDYFDLYGWGYENIISVMNMVNIRAIFVPENGWAYNSKGWTVSADGGYGPIAVNVAYSTAMANNTALRLQRLDGQADFPSDPAKGMMGFGVRFTQDVAKDIPLAAYAGISQNLNKEQTRWGVAAKVGYQTLATVQLGAMGFNKAKAGVGPDGEDSWFSRMEVRGVVMPISLFSLDVSSVLNIDKERYLPTTGETNMLNEFDIRANLMPNKYATFSVGYLVLGAEGYYSMISNEIGRIGHKSSGLGKGGIYFEGLLKF